MMTEQEAAAWRPELTGWSDDILPFYQAIAPTIPDAGTLVEVGVAHGRSAVFMCEQIAGRAIHFFAIDTSPKPRALEGLPVCFLQGPSVEWAENFADDSVDFVFIDADHSEAGMRADLAAWAPKIKPGGILAGHDYSAADWPGVVRAVDEFVKLRGLTLTRPGRSIWELRIPAVAP